ncbi:MAG TPA: transglutaminase-like cysteine peptidase, partial [Pseudomonas sp.]
MISLQLEGKRVLTTLCLLAGLLLGFRVHAWGDFARIIQLAEQQHGALGPGRERLQEWADLIGAGVNLDEQQQLHLVNAFFNRTLLFIDDVRTWQQIDYWATPVEALIKGAGDCEDYAIAK